MKNWVRAGILLCLFLSVETICFADNPYLKFHIPKKTLEIANDTPNVKPTAVEPTSPVVRVGIGTEGFKSYTRTSVSIYGTSEIILCDNDTAVKTFPAGVNVNIKLNSQGSFDITTDNGEKIASVNGVVRFVCPQGLLGVRWLKRAGVNALYHGALEIVKANETSFNLVNIIEVEQYLRGVVPNEMPVSFGLEALKAQSVAARNYVLSPRTKASPNYDVVDSVASQVYYGAGTEKKLSDTAVKETEGIVAIYDWDLILAQYSSTAGGYTESYSNSFSDPYSKAFPSKEKPYLIARPDIIGQEPLNTDEAALTYYKSKPDSYDIRSPYFRWEREWSSDELKNILESNLPAQSATGFVKPAFNKGDKLGTLQDIRVHRRGNSGKIVELEIYTDKGNYKVYKELVIRRLFTKSGKAMPSANMAFELTKDADGNLSDIKVYGGGYGHGVGMSQFGAGFMGKELNIPYYKILQHYYSGITLGTKPFTIVSETGKNSYTQRFFNTNNYAKIKLDNKNGISELFVYINGYGKTVTLPLSILGDKRFVEIDISKDLKDGENEITFVLQENDFNKKSLKGYVELVEKDDNDGLW